MKGKILIVEDEKRLSDIIALYIKKEGYDVLCAFNGIEAEQYLDSEKFDLVILDVMMPGKDGWSILRRIKNNDDTPVILTTARGEEEDRVFGLELGAEDYMVKPISMRELVLRINLRIGNRSSKKRDLKFGGLTINEDSREVLEKDTPVILTPREFDLLIFLLKNTNQVFTREQLLDKVWGYDFFGDTRTVDTHVKNLREKVLYCSEHLKTIWGVGYKIEG
jgi:DNA-binding response OmpR family regulator